MKDLWPEQIGKITYTSPVSILQEQAHYLEKKTDGIVKADLYKMRQVSGEREIEYGFFLIAPFLEDYSYNLFGFRFSVATLYPVKFDIDPDIQTEAGIDPVRTAWNIIAENEEAFINMLEHIFSSKKVIRIIDSLMSQSRPFVPQEDDIPF